MKTFELMTTLGVRLGLGELVFDDKNKSYHLKFDDEILTFEKRADALVISCELGSAKDQGTMYKSILEASHAGLHTGLNSLGLDSASNMFVLSCMVEADMEYDDFEKKISRLIVYARQWKKIIEDGGTVTKEVLPPNALFV